ANQSRQEANHQAQDHRTATTTASPGDGLNVNPVSSTLSCFSAQFVQKVLTTYNTDHGAGHADRAYRPVASGRKGPSANFGGARKRVSAGAGRAPAFSLG